MPQSALLDSSAKKLAVGGGQKNNARYLMHMSGEKY
jgi:hypothetical protein